MQWNTPPSAGSTRWRRAVAMIETNQENTVCKNKNRLAFQFPDTEAEGRRPDLGGTTSWSELNSGLSFGCPRCHPRCHAGCGTGSHRFEMWVSGIGPGRWIRAKSKCGCPRLVLDWLQTPRGRIPGGNFGHSDGYRRGRRVSRPAPKNHFAHVRSHAERDARWTRRDAASGGRDAAPYSRPMVAIQPRLPLSQPGA